MRIELVRPADLTRELIDRWIEIQRSQPWLHDPFARPEFTLAVASVRSDVEVAVLEESGEVVGFFPFQRSRWNTGRPVGALLSDAQRIPVRADVNWDPADVVRACRLRTWGFQQIPAEQREFLPYATDFHDAVYMDLEGGFEKYARLRREAGSQKLKELERCLRRTERRFGPVRFEIQTLDASALESLIAWKSAQYCRAGATDVLSFRWTNQLVRQSLTWTSPGFSSLLSALYIGDQLAAVELGLRSHEVLHAWFAAYNRNFAESSPGILLIADAGEGRTGVGN